jgi:cbb3-type cytochrome oxidase subunit 3
MKTQKPPSRAKIKFWWALAFLIVLTAGVYFVLGKKEKPLFDPKTYKITFKVDEDLLKKSQDVLDQRAQLDKSLWAPEVRAQYYERTAIQLWDDLRNQEDKFAVLEKFQVGELSWGEPVTVRELKDGVRLTRYEGEQHHLPQTQWKAFVRGLRSRGFRLVQLEFHHKNFQDSPGQNAHSLFSFVFHLEQPASRKRFMVEGLADVDWSPQEDSLGNYIPAVIKAKSFVVKERRGNPLFTKLMEYTPGEGVGQSGAIDPLLVYDLKGNGYSDIILPQFNEVLWNQGHGRFKTGLLCDRFSRGVGKTVTCALIADLTGDGIPDLLICRKYGNPLLFVGQAGGRFPDPPLEIVIPGATWDNPSVVTAGDIRGTGRLDLFIGQYKIPFMEPAGIQAPYFDSNDGYPSYLLLNQGDGTFKDGTESAGLGKKRFRHTYSASFVDLAGTGRLDLITVNDFAGIDVFRNDGKGHFIDVTDQAVDQRHMFGMSHSFGDYNLDGKLDIYAVGMSSTTAKRLTAMGLGREEYPEYQKMRPVMGYGNRMFLAQGDGTFKQAPFNDQVAATGWSWGCTTLDFDGDGTPDLYIANGHISGKTAADYCTTFWRHDIYPVKSFSREARFLSLDQGLEALRNRTVSWNPFEHKFLFMNLDGKEFVNVSFLMGVGFEFDGRCVVSDDLELTGNPDILISDVSTDSPAKLYVMKNQGAGPHHWIGVRLRELPGLSAMGARITVTSALGTQVSAIVSGDSFRSQHSSTRLFGLGKTKQVDAIEVRWIGGKSKRIENPKVDRYYDVQP